MKFDLCCSAFILWPRGPPPPAASSSAAALSFHVFLLAAADFRLMGTCKCTAALHPCSPSWQVLIPGSWASCLALWSHTQAFFLPGSHLHWVTYNKACCRGGHQAGRLEPPRACLALWRHLACCCVSCI